MKPMIFHQPMMLLLLLLVPVFVAVFRLRIVRQRKDMERFGEGAKDRRSEHFSMEPWRLGLLVMATMMIIVALTRPAIHPHPQMIPRDGRDVVFLLDVSKSMLAEDRLPNRLLSAKSAIAECVQSLDDHRVGLVVFAGSSSIVCPLTMDTDFFMNSLEKVGPESVAHGGTRIGDALLKVCDKLFSETDQGYKDIVLISDGGDQSDGLKKAVEQLNEKEVRLIAIGVGDQKQGSRIPVSGSQQGPSDYMTYKNQEVWSRLDGAQLSGLVKQCKQAAYLPVGTRQMRLDHIYGRLSEQGGTQQLAEESVMVYDEIFQGFVALALLFLILMILIPHSIHRPFKGGSVVVSMIFFMTLSPHLNAADDARSHYLKGNTHYRAGEFSEAAQSYERALEQSPTGHLIRDVTYNLGNAYFQASKATETSYEALSLVNQSVAMYRRVLLHHKHDQDAAVNNELARISRRELEQTIKEEEKRRHEMEAILDQIREKLLILITQQQKNLPQADEPEDVMPKKWGELEQQVADGTDQAATQVNEFNEKFFKGIPRDLTPLAETKKHIATAFLNEKQGIMVCKTQWAEALSKGRTSLKALQDALASLPQDPEGSDQDSEQGDEREEGEEGASDEDGEESEGEEGEGDEGEQGEMESMNSTKIDLESMELPPPTNSPEDVIRMSQEMQEARQAAGAKKKGKPVEKDW